MTWPVVWTVLRERGVREVAQPVINRYVAGELSLEAAARQLATIVRAAVRWKTERLRPRIVKLDPNVAVNLRFISPEQKGSPANLRLFPRCTFGTQKTPPTRNPNPGDVYDEALRLNAIYDSFKSLARLLALYQGVSRLLHGSREDAA